jgi:hypothetical protein
MKAGLSAYKAKLRTLIPAEWVLRVGDGKVGIGYDQATTEGEKSNPASITVTERVGSMFVERLVIRFKAEHYLVRMAVLELIIDDLASRGIRAKALVIDATSERAGAQQCADQFAGRCPVEMFIASANIEEGKLKYPAKVVLSERYVQTFEDNLMSMPAAPWVLADHQLVKKAGGRFVIEEDGAGNHGDTWISGMLSVWAIMSKSERAEAMAVDITGAKDGRRPGLLDCFQRGGGQSGRLPI